VNPYEHHGTGELRDGVRCPELNVSSSSSLLGDYDGVVLFVGVLGDSHVSLLRVGLRERPPMSRPIACVSSFGSSPTARAGFADGAGKRVGFALLHAIHAPDIGDREQAWVSSR
jgi:hypothetical protein